MLNTMHCNLKRLLGLLLIVVILVLAIATFVEAQNGTAFIKEYCYNSLWFFILLASIGVLAVVYIVKQKMWKNISALLLHIALLIILCGAGVTWCCAQKGVVHIRKGEVQNVYFQQPDNLVRPLPFKIQLDTFAIKYYSGTTAPADYQSDVRIIDADQTTSFTISMNKILSYKGYRLYQASFDEDNNGTWLSLNYDPIGIAITYMGYFLLALSAILMFFSPNSGFRRLLSNPILKKSFVVLLFAFCFNNLSGQTTQKIKPIWPKTSADSAAYQQVIYNNRVVPFNTLARDFVVKLYGKPSYKGLTAEQVVGSWLLFPNVWKNEPMILIKNNELQNILGLDSKYARYLDFFDSVGNYKLKELWSKTNVNSVGDKKNSQLQKAIIQADEKIAIVTMLQHNELIKPITEEVQPLSSFKVKAELLYNKIPFCKVLFMFNLTVGFLAFFLMVINIITTYNSATNLAILRYKTVITKIEWLLENTLLVSLIFHSIGIALYWFVSGRVPLSNGYETMMFVAWCILFVAWCLRSKYNFVVTFGFILSGFALLVAWLGQKNPQITPLMPVLLSPWLSIHVSLIMMSYALFGFTFLNAILAIALNCINGIVYQPIIGRLTVYSKLMLYPATLLLGVGIFIGAIWANISWGSYWSWDPKEVWALITFFVYSAAFHTNSIKYFNKPLFFHIYITFAFATVLMTYFGVNNMLGGMHAYK